MTQTQVQPEATQSASTSDQSQEQVCKYYGELVTYRVMFFVNAYN